MDKKLSIVQRSTDKTGWNKSNQFSTTDIKNIKSDTSATTDKSLNAIPSPLARIHLFEAAFDLVGKDESNNTCHSGDTYNKIVSDCFDVFELIYNWNNHLNDNKKLEIIKWEKEIEIDLLMRGTKRNRLLGETLDVFFKEEAFGKMNEILIIKLNGKVLAGSSPFTGFFTTPDVMQNCVLHNPLSRRNYFSRILPFADRRPEIKKIIYDFFNSHSSNIKGHTQIVRDYLFRYNNTIDDSLNLSLEPIKSHYHELFGQTLYSTTIKTETDYFEKYLVKINYRLNYNCFQVPQNSNIDRKHDYLLPFTPTFYQDFNKNDIESLVTIHEADKKTVTVTIQLKERKYSKVYQTNKIKEEHGEIVDLYETHGIKINLGIFPFIKIVESQDKISYLNALDYYNDFYKVLFVCEDSNYQSSNKDFKLSFGIHNEPLLTSPLETGYKIFVDHRTILERDKSQVGSSYYTLQAANGENMCFDFIQVELPSFLRSGIKCTVVPKWREKNLGKRQLDYSIDFGTTTTFIAYTDDANRQSEPKPLSFDINSERADSDYIVAMLNLPLQKSPQSTHIAGFEQLSAFPESIEVQRQEFIPSLINNGSYPVPFRTALYQKSNTLLDQKKLFSNTNIGFTYQRTDNNLTGLNQKFITNIKWNIKTESDKENTGVFVEEILRMLKLKTLLNNGDPQKTQLTWFSPLSFTPAARKIYKELWEDRFIEIFRTREEKIHNISESEAPYYYYQTKAGINDKSAVLTMDIGGGTTDLMYVRDKPVLCSSVHFGANILWGNGFNELTKTAKENGIYNAIKSNINSRLKDTLLNQLNKNFESEASEYSSEEIINFWILNDDTTKVLKELNKSQFRLSYLLHFSALVYHSYQILSDNGEPVPTCIIFSGNGSKYLDFIESDLYIGKICNYFALQIFGEVQKDVQIILPKANRKEATCYGGLYTEFKKQQQYKNVNLTGVEAPGLDIKIYSDIYTDKELAVKNLTISFLKFIEFFFSMNQSTGLNFRTTFGIDTDLDAVKAFILTHTSENIDSGMFLLKKSIKMDEEVTDSLFFLPLIGLLFKLNNLSSIDLNGFKKKHKFFAVSVDDNGSFSADSFIPDRKSDSIFLIEIAQDDPETGFISVIPEQTVYKRAVGAITNYLLPVCEWNEFPVETDSEIKVLEKGIIVRKGPNWEIKQKIKIVFI